MYPTAAFCTVPLSPHPHALPCFATPPRIAHRTSRDYTHLTATCPCPAASPSGDLGSISKVYDNLTKVAATTRPAQGYPSALPIDGNKDGSFLTMLSKGGLIFGIINVVGNFGTVFVDQAYWQSAIAGEQARTPALPVRPASCQDQLPCL